MKRLLCALLLAACLSASPTTITDVLYQPYNGLPAAGVNVTISQLAFFNAANSYFPAWSVTIHPVTDASGNLSVQLEPNPAGQPYLVVLTYPNGVITKEYWDVPASGTPLTIKQVITTVGPTPPLGFVQLSQLAQTGAIQGNVITWNNTLKRWEADAPAGGVTASQIQTNALVCADDTGPDGDRYAVTISPAPAQPLTQYATFCFQAAHASLTSFPSATLNVNGSGAKTIFNQSALSLSSGDIIAGQIVFVSWSVSNNAWMMTSVSAATALQGVDLNSINQVQATHLLSALPANQGGTGATSLAAHGPLIGAGTGPIVAGSPGTLGQCWTSNGASADATFQACPGGSATQTNSLLWVPSDGNVSQSVPEASGVIFCYAFPLAAPAQFTTAYQYISGAVPASVYGVAIYDASGNRLTAATQTGTLTSSTGPFHSAFGGGTLTLTPSTAGKFSLCYTSSAGVGLAFVSPPAQLSGYIQPSGNPVFFTGAVANPATFNGATITWPTTLGTPISVTGGSGNFPTTLLLP